MTAPPIAAGVDIGTNSLLLTVARAGPHDLQVLEERCVVTRLGQGLDQQGRLAPEAMERTLAVLEEFGAAIVALGATARAAGTSALRRAGQGQHRAERDRFLERARQSLGVPVEVLSGSDEARLGCLGALSGLPGISLEHRPLIVDPGGGSTEVFDTERAGEGVSLEIGAVRLTERFIAPSDHDPPRPDDLEALVTRARSEMERLTPAPERPVVSLGGTATTLAAISTGLETYQPHRVHGSRLTPGKIRSLRDRLAALTLAEREAVPGLQPGRADIIVAGAVILEEVLLRLGAEETIVSDRGLRFGLIEEILTADPHSTSSQE